MISTTLSLWGKGSITLPKKWRDRFDTKHFLAEEDAKGNLVIKPIKKADEENIVYYERKDGSFGLRFPEGIEMGKFAEMVKKANATLDKEEKAKRMKAGKITTKRKHG